MTLEVFLNRSRLLRRLKSGAFADVLDLYTDKLRQGGYSEEYAAQAFRLIKRFSQWLTGHGLRPRDIDERLVARFFRSRAQCQVQTSVDRSAMRRLLAILREAGVIGPSLPPSLNPVEQLLADYQGYLQRKLGVSPATTVAYSSYLRPFLRSLALNCIADIARITASDSIRYIEEHAGDGSPATAVAFCSRLRSFLRYLSAEGLVTEDLSAYVPLVKARGQVRLPAYLSKAQVQQVLQGCGRATAKERRDYAVLLLLARLGLRANEVALLTLDDIDWRAGQLHVQGKGRKRATMPLLPEVGEAIAAYLRDGRPISGSRRVFLRSHAPHIGFTSSYAVIHIARAAINAANITGVAHRGSHLFRHSLATGLLGSGATLTEIGQVLRHQNHDTTRIYAKVDLASLRRLATPWPGAVQ